MFYPEYILCDQGPLSRPWIVANWPDQVSSKDISEANVENYCRSIREPQVHSGSLRSP